MISSVVTKGFVNHVGTNCAAIVIQCRLEYKGRGEIERRMKISSISHGLK